MNNNEADWLRGLDKINVRKAHANKIDTSNQQRLINTINNLTDWTKHCTNSINKLIKRLIYNFLKTKHHVFVTYLSWNLFTEHI